MNDAMPFGWVELADSALQRLRKELEEKGKGVVDEMGVLAIHAGYADYFFPGTSVLQTRPRYLFFVCWNLLWLARQRGVTTANLLSRKDKAELWVTDQLVASRDRVGASDGRSPNMNGIIGVNVFQEQPPRAPAQRVDFIYWTALKRWGFYHSSVASSRTSLFRRWRGSAVGRLGTNSDEGRDDVVAPDWIAQFAVPDAPDDWQSKEFDRLDFELTRLEATWLQGRLLTLEEAEEGPCLLAKAAELCADLPPENDPDRRPWTDPLVIRSAKVAGQSDRLDRARKASSLGHYVRAIYAALVERTVEMTRPATPTPLRHYRNLLQKLLADRAMRVTALGLSLRELYSDVPRIPTLLRQCLEHLQEGLRRIEAGEDVEVVFLNPATHGLFEKLEVRRKDHRARLPRDNAARRLDFDSTTVGVYDLDYRWNVVRLLLRDLHRGLVRS